MSSGNAASRSGGRDGLGKTCDGGDGAVRQSLLAEPHPLSRLWRSPPMRIAIYQLDAFTDRRFAGNPAAVCPLEAWLPDGTLQAIAAENNLSETAFFVPGGDGYELRWFTPMM